MSDDIRELVDELRSDVRRLERQVEFLERELAAEAEAQVWLTADLQEAKNSIEYHESRLELLEEMDDD